MRKFIINFLILFPLLFYLSYANVSSCQTLSGGSYKVTQNITTSGTCFNTNSHITLDCQGHTITGNGDTTYRAIMIGDDQNITIKNCIFENFGRGIEISRSSDTVFENVTINSSSYRGLLMYQAVNNVFENVTIDLSEYGIYMYGNANYNNFTNVNVYNSTNIGLLVTGTGGGSYNNFNNLSTINNGGDGIQVYSDSNYNSFNNVLSENNGRYGLFIAGLVTGNNFTNIISNNNDIGFFTYENSNNIVVDSNFKDNDYGIYVGKSSNNYFDNVSSTNNNYNIYLRYNSDNNIFTNSTFIDSRYYDLYFYYSSTSETPSDNIFYENLIGTEIYSRSWAYTKPNYFNYTVGGNIIGNYWEDNNCISSKQNGYYICEDDFIISDANNIVDYAPLTDKYYIDRCQQLNVSEDYYLANNIVTSSDCFSIVTDNVSLNCDGHSIVGNGGNGISINNVIKTNISSCLITNFSQGIKFNYSNNSIIYENKLNNDLDIVLDNSINNNFYLNFIDNKNKIVSNNWTNNFFNISLSGINVGNIWNNSCTIYEVRGNYRVCIDPSNYIINLSLGISDYAPVVKNYNMTSCENISYSSNVFLSNDITSSNSCISINSNDVEIDCRGYSIIGSGSGDGILIKDYENINIKNCNIKNFSNGINLISSNNNIFENSNFTNNSIGINFLASSNNKFYYINSNNNSNSGVYLEENSYYNYFDNLNTFYNSDGIYITSSYNYNNNTFNNTKSYYNVYGMDLYNTKGNKFLNSNFSYNLQDGIYSGNGINENLFNNIITSFNGDVGLDTWTFRNNNIFNFISHDNGRTGMIIAHTSNNNFTNITSFRNGDYGIRWDDSTTTGSPNYYENIHVYENNDSGLFTWYKFENSYVKNVLSENNKGSGIDFCEEIENVNFENITVRNNAKSGILLDCGKIRNNNFSNIIVENNSGWGLLIRNTYSGAYNNSFDNLVLSNNSKGIFLEGTNNNTFSNSRISSNDNNSLILNFDGDSYIPNKVHGNYIFTNISTNYKNTCGILTNGSLMCWGNNYYGELGKSYEELEESDIPVFVGDNIFKSIVSGGNFFCGLLLNGSAMCWGDNNDGQLGDGTTEDKDTPTYVLGNYQFTQLGAGNYHVCGLLSSGNIMCWGDNYRGQLGDGTTISKSTPLSIDSNLYFKQIEGGTYHTCGILTNGNLMCWGYNYYGQLGTGDNTNKLTPTSVIGNYNFKYISSGGYQTCGILTNGSSMCWGRNTEGQLGNGLTSHSNTPYYVNISDQFKLIDTSGYSTCGILTNDSLMCWGGNTYGQLGTNNTNNYYIPTSVIGNYDFKIISNGKSNDYHTCGILTNGSSMCWGNGRSGQLGTGNNTQYTYIQYEVIDNLFYGNSIDGNIFSKNWKYSSKNYFNYSNGSNNIGNYWSDLNCISSNQVNNYRICNNPSQYVVDLDNSIIDYAPLAQSLVIGIIDYSSETPDDGSVTSSKNILIKVDETGGNSMYECKLNFNGTIYNMSFSSNSCSYTYVIDSNISLNYTFFVSYNNDSQTLSSRTFTYDPNAPNESNSGTSKLASIFPVGGATSMFVTFLTLFIFFIFRK